MRRNLTALPSPFRLRGNQRPDHPPPPEAAREVGERGVRPSGWLMRSQWRGRVLVANRSAPTRRSHRSGGTVRRRYPSTAKP